MWLMFNTEFVIIHYISFEILLSKLLRIISLFILFLFGLMCFFIKVWCLNNLFFIWLAQI